MSRILFAYGTLRPGGQSVVKVPGQLFDLGWFPGIKMDLPGEVICEKIEVDDWSAVDRYEGYYPDDHESSLYIRRPFRDGFIYEFNREVNPVKKVTTGDWLDYTSQESGKYGGRFGKRS